VQNCSHRKRRIVLTAALLFRNTLKGARRGYLPLNQR
jgi:hypothetical protein